MSPDEKYMLPNMNNTYGDMNLSPLLDQLGIKNMTLGWIPVFFPTNTMSNLAQPMTLPQNPQGFVGANTTIPEMNNTQSSPTQFPNNMNSLPFNNFENPSSAMLQALRDFDLDLDEETDLSRVPENRVNRIITEIEQNNPGIFSLFEAYRIPRPIARLIMRRIIRLTLNYCRDNR